MQFNEFSAGLSGGTELRHHEKREENGNSFQGGDPFSPYPRRKSGYWQGVVTTWNTRFDSLGDIRHALAMRDIDKVERVERRGRHEVLKTGLRADIALQMGSRV